MNRAAIFFLVLAPLVRAEEPKKPPAATVEVRLSDGSRINLALLDESVPIVAGCEINDSPFEPSCKRCRRLAAEKGDDLPIEWLGREQRYREKLATPDVTVADLIARYRGSQGRSPWLVPVPESWIEAAMKATRDMGFDAAVAVTDATGNLRAFQRADGAPFFTAEVAVNKAWTAASCGIATHVWNGYIADPKLAPLEWKRFS